MDCDSVWPPWPSCLGPKRDVGAGWKLTLPPPKERDFPQQAWGLGRQVWWALSSPCVTGVHLLSRGSFIEHLLCAWCCARLLGGRRGQGRHRIRGSGEFSLWMRDMGWQHCGGAAKSEPQPIGLSRGGCLALAGCLLWGRRGGGPCCVHGSPQFAALLRLIPQGSRAGAPPLPWFVVWMCEAQQGLRCPHPMGLRSVLRRLLKQALNLTRVPPLLPGTLTWLSLLY